MGPRAAALVLLVVVAGCASLPSAPGDGGADTRDPGAGTAPAAGATPTAEPTPTVDPDNPWRETELAVAVTAPEDDGRAYEPLVAAALAYWAANADRYAGYPVSFSLVEEPADADLVVAFVDRVGDCGTVSDPAGCAPRFTRPGQVYRPATVEVLAGLSDDSTVLVTKHELGHALGLGHEDAPAAVMTPTADLTTLPARNATDRALPWRDPELSVYVDYGDADDPATLRDQLDRALDYYDGGADGTVPGNLTFVRTDNRTAADVVVEFRGSDACGGDGGSCARRSGVDPDGDGALEWYTRLAVTVGVDAEAAGWHVAYWLGYGMGFTDERDWPDPLRNASYEDRRGEWWLS